MLDVTPEEAEINCHRFCHGGQVAREARRNRFLRCEIEFPIGRGRPLGQGPLLLADDFVSGLYIMSYKYSYKLSLARSHWRKGCLNNDVRIGG
jgi:hypothetical protein